VARSTAPEATGDYNVRGAQQVPLKYILGTELFRQLPTHIIKTSN